MTMIGIAFGLIFPLAASASLPAPHKAIIVPYVSIGSIGFGTAKSKAIGSWGASNLCSVGTKNRETCLWTTPGDSDYPAESGVLELANGKVCGMLIRAGTNFSGSGQLDVTRLKGWKTREGLGLGSPVGAARKLLGADLLGQKAGVTFVIATGTTPASAKQVEEIEMYKGDCKVT
jgi:hypothetical protein